MLYYKTVGDKWFLHSVDFTNRTTDNYYLSFSISKNTKITPIFTTQQNGNDNATATCTNAEIKNGYVNYTYKFTVNENYSGWAFPGICIGGNSEGYLFDVSFVAENEPYKELFSNNNFQNGYLDNWALGAYYEFNNDRLGLTEYTSDDASLALRVVEFDADAIADDNAAVHYGDVNNDGVIDICDLIGLKKAIANKVEYNANTAACDCDSDKSITSADLVVLRKHLLGIEKIVWKDSIKKNMQSAHLLSGGADEAAASKKKSVANFDDNLISVSGRTYYIAKNGNSENDGLSPEKPITVDKLNELELDAGDAVLFNRGDTFRISQSVRILAGVSYGAYGVGAKPIISGSLKDYSDEDLWTTSDGNVWKTTIDVECAANIIFDNGDYVGVAKQSLSEIAKDGDFYFDNTAKTFYLYLRHYNPAMLFKSIEISSVAVALNGYGSSAENVKIHNLNIKFVAEHALVLYNSNGVQISGCEISWIGGMYMDDGSGERLGNAIQLWDEASNVTVTNNYIYQVYDAAFTFQGSKHSDYNSIEFSDNVIEYTSMNFEFWGNESYGEMRNINISNNIMRFGGYGFSSVQRKDITSQAYILGWSKDYYGISNFNITENTFDVSNCYCFYATEVLDKLNINGNVYYQNGNCNYPIIRNGEIVPKDEKTFLNQVTQIDKYAIVNWLS